MCDVRAAVNEKEFRGKYSRTWNQVARSCPTQHLLPDSIAGNTRHPIDTCYRILSIEMRDWQFMFCTNITAKWKHHNFDFNGRLVIGHCAYRIVCENVSTSVGISCEYRPIPRSGQQRAVRHIGKMRRNKGNSVDERCERVKMPFLDTISLFVRWLFGTIHCRARWGWSPNTHYSKNGM